MAYEKADYDILSQTADVGFDGERMKLTEAVDATVDKAAKMSIETGKKSKVVVEIVLQPEGTKGLQLKAKVKAQIPEPNTPAVLVFYTSRGLTFDDGEQGRLPARLETVGGDKA